MNNEIQLFFKELHEIQDSSISIMLCNIDKYDKYEDILKDLSYDIIYKIMELLDGYWNESLEYEIVNVKNKAVINSNCNLHNLCEVFLALTDI